MSIGASSLNRANLDNVLGNWATMIANMNAQAVILKSTCDTLGLAGLEAAPLSYSVADAIAYTAAYNDLVNFGKVFNGLMYVVPGATVNTGVPTTNSAGNFGYNFGISINKAAGIGF